jgi:hypothetical protein
MDYPVSPLSAPRKVSALGTFKRGGNIAICVFTILTLAGSNRLTADDSANLVSLAKRYWLPGQVFQPADRPVALDFAVTARTLLSEPLPAPVLPALHTAELAVFNSAPEPVEIGSVALAAVQQQSPSAPTSAGDQSNGQSGAPGSFAQVEKLGDAPTSNTLEFLRQQAVLLHCGECQFDWGLTYSVLDDRFAQLAVNGGTATLSNAHEVLRLMSIPFAVRYGVTDNLQAYLNAPLGWSNSETSTDTGGSLTNNFVGVGDISGGFSYHLCKGCGAYVPDVIGTIGFVAPSGHATFNSSLLAPNSVLGQGFWQITSNLLFVHTLDPVVFYYGAGYVHRFEADINDLQVNGGQEFDYLAGVGFAVNPWITISGSVLGAYLTRYSVNDVSIPGSDFDVMRLRVSVTIVKDKHICEPFGEVAMTPESPSRVGVVFTY